MNSCLVLAVAGSGGVLTTIEGLAGGEGQDGEALDPVAAFSAAADAELAQARPLRDNAYKVALTRNVIVQTLAELCA